MLVNSPDPVIDANLAIALNALLAEHSVTRAAARLHTSPAAMSRTLARLRRILGDPLLVRAGQVMVPTPRAEPCARKPPRWCAAWVRCSAPAPASTPRV
ncbi:helix-turn-helix domain-containing protein [Nocardia salmonicida]|uniref:helix-turn-helix domain-containing protein n=1 Tax=Nocardia salmonicida TaxID=53431 RepID=UPI002E28142C|nr:LysR family transcriptional regulator [Nocardia salmonicida]